LPVATIESVDHKPYTGEKSIRLKLPVLKRLLLARWAGVAKLLISGGAEPACPWIVQIINAATNLDQQIEQRPSSAEETPRLPLPAPLELA
jgi:hypothetical protein